MPSLAEASDLMQRGHRAADPVGEEPRQKPRSGGPRILGVSQVTEPEASMALQNKPPGLYAG